jgi:soluble lytic murein transglycosylase-like protein
LIELIIVIALELAVPPELVISIALTENPTLNPAAINYNVDGSMDCGIMQLNTCWYTVENWADPETNIRAGVAHIKWLMGQGLGVWHIAVAYNAGISRVYNPPSASKIYADKVYAQYRELLDGKAISYDRR